MAADEDKPKATKPDEERRSGRERRQRPPVTIDLQAEKAGDKPAAGAAGGEAPKAAAAGAAGAAARRSAEPSSSAASAAASSPPPPPKEEPGRGRTPPPPRGDGWTRIVAAGVIGGVAALLLVIVLQASGFLPVPGRTAATEASREAQSAADATAALDRRVTAIEAMTADLPSLRADIQGLAGRVSAVESGIPPLASKSDVAALKTEIASLGQRLDAMPAAASPNDLAALANRVARLEAQPVTGGGADSGDAGAAAAASAALAGRVDDAEARLTSLGQRVDALDAKIAALAGASASQVKSDEAARAIAIVALRRAADGDQPFVADLDLAVALGIAGDVAGELRPLAAKGVATVADLQAGFPAVADAIVAATSAANPNAGFFERLVGSARGLVTVRPTTPQPGNDPPAVLSRVEAAVNRGDLATALSEREALPAAGKDASAAWAAKARDRVTVDRLVARIAGSAGAADK
jgi:hypothetical protein